MKNRIKEIRKDQKMTQQKLADLFGVKRNTVAQWETGVNAITNQTIEQYCKAFHVNRQWLETGEGEKYRKATNEDRIGEVTNIMIDIDPDSDTLALIEKITKLDSEMVHALAVIVDRLQK